MAEKVKNTPGSKIEIVQICECRKKLLTTINSFLDLYLPTR